MPKKGYKRRVWVPLFKNDTQRTLRTKNVVKFRILGYSVQLNIFIGFYHYICCNGGKQVLICDQNLTGD